MQFDFTAPLYLLFQSRYVFCLPFSTGLYLKLGLVCLPFRCVSYFGWFEHDLNMFLIANASGLMLIQCDPLAFVLLNMVTILWGLDYGYQSGFGILFHFTAIMINQRKRKQDYSKETFTDRHISDQFHK